MGQFEIGSVVNRQLMATREKQHTSLIGQGVDFDTEDAQEVDGLVNRRRIQPFSSFGLEQKTENLNPPVRRYMDDIIDVAEPNAVREIVDLVRQYPRSRNRGIDDGCHQYR